MSFFGIQGISHADPDEKPIGGGGEADIYLVRHDKYGYIRAARRYREPVKTQEGWEKFEKRCGQLMRLGNGNHPNIIHIYNNYRTEGRFPAVEVDYIKGENLREYLKKDFLPIEEVIRIVEQISSALSYCHYDTYKFCMNRETDGNVLKADPNDGDKLQELTENDCKILAQKYRVIHNDIQSGNIMRREDGIYILIDFGLSVEGNESLGSTSFRRENGHPEYKAPERWKVEDKKLSQPTTQSDIYSFGIVLFECLAGRVPFPSKIAQSSYSPERDDAQLRKAHQTMPLPDVLDLRKKHFKETHNGEDYKEIIPKWLKEVVERCLQKEPQKRFEDGKELHEFVVEGMKKQEEEKKQEAEKVLKDLIDKCEKLEVKNVSLGGEIVRLNQELSELRKGGGSSGGSGSSSKRLEEALKKIELLKQEKKKLEEDIDKLKNKISELEEENERLKLQNNELKEKLKKAKEEIDRLNREIAELQKKIKELEYKLRRANERIEELEYENEKHHEELYSKKRRLRIISIMAVLVLLGGMMWHIWTSRSRNIEILDLRRENALMDSTLILKSDSLKQKDEIIDKLTSDKEALLDTIYKLL